MKKPAPAADQILEVWVQPRASRNEIVGYRDGYLRVRVTAPPKEGEANHLLRSVLAEALGIPVSRVEIVSGQKSKRKRVRIVNALPASLQALEETGRTGKP